jgi:hypothetical protein
MFDHLKIQVGVIKAYLQIEKKLDVFMCCRNSLERRDFRGVGKMASVLGNRCSALRGGPQFGLRNMWKGPKWAFFTKAEEV